MGRKKNKPIQNKKKIVEEREASPFDSIVLKEKKIDAQPKKALVKNKKPSEIVQGYNPNISFADILYSFEKTGNPYSMPKPKAGKSDAKESFGDILDKWEGRGKNRSQSSKKSAKAEYKPTKSFGDILSAFENDAPRKKESDEQNPKKEEEIVVSDLFRKEDEDNKRSAISAWSILGGNGKKIAKEEKKEETIVIKSEIKPKSTPYKPKHDFSEILDEFENKTANLIKSIDSAKDEKINDQGRSISEAKEKIVPLSEDGFFKKEDDDNKKAKNVSWSIIGGRNEDYIRPDIRDEKLISSYDNKENEKSRKQEYRPEKEFSDILRTFEKKPSNNDIKDEIKTFEEILKEKGDDSTSKPKLTITKLRAMLPQATLDLHGETQQEAERLIKDFLSECKEHGIRKICIITGKGLHSEGGEGVIRPIAERVLEESGLVSEKNNAPLNAGGSGAIWIILKA